MPSTPEAVHNESPKIQGHWRQLTANVNLSSIWYTLENKIVLKFDKLKDEKRIWGIQNIEICTILF